MKSSIAERETLRPLGDRVLIRREKARDRTEGGIFIPDGARAKSAYGTVVRVGPGKPSAERSATGSDDQMQVSEGDRVLFSLYAGQDVKLLGDDEGELILISQDDILGVVEAE